MSGSNNSDRGRNSMALLPNLDLSESVYLYEIFQSESLCHCLDSA